MSSWLPGILAFKVLSNDLGPREAGRDLQIHSNLNIEPGCMVGSGGKGSWAQEYFMCHGVSSKASNSTPLFTDYSVQKLACSMAT